MVFLPGCEILSVGSALPPIWWICRARSSQPHPRLGTLATGRAVGPDMADEHLSLRSRLEASRRDDLFYVWGYSSRASTQFRYLYVAVGKVGCSTVKRVLHRLESLPEPADWGHVHDSGFELLLNRFTTDEVEAILADSAWLRFCFVRNPYDRLFSAWKQKIGNTWDTQYAAFRDAIRSSVGYPPARDGVAPVVSFADFVRYVCHSREREAVCDGHWGRQVDLLLYDLIPYDVVGRFESFATDFRSTLVRLGAPSSIVEMADEVSNPTTTVPLAAVFDSDLAAMVYHHYRADFDTFGYDRESWRYYASWD